MPREALRFEELSRRHAGGRVPPLVVERGGRPGLVNDRLVEIYQRGFCGVHDVPLGLILPKTVSSRPSGEKWEEGDLHLNESVIPDWKPLCRMIRNFTTDDGARPGDKSCRQCDVEHAALAEEVGRAVAYLCCYGMIDFAVPVKVGQFVVAVLLSGQLLPKKGRIWPSGLVGIEPATLEAQDDLVDLDSLSVKRINAVADYGIGAEEIQTTLAKHAKACPRVGPRVVEDLLKRIDTAASLLSDLATNTYELEKSRLASFIRFGFADPLAILKGDLSNQPEALCQLESSLKSFSTLLGLEFTALCREKGCIGTLIRGEILCETGLGPPMGKQRTFSLELQSASPSESGDIQDIPLGGLSDTPLAKQINERYRSAGIDSPMLLCVTPRQTPGFMMLLGKLEKDWHSSLPEIDAQSISDISSIACLVCETLHLLQDVHQTQEAMDRFIEDVAHDIRAPIQSIITKAALLKRARLQKNEYVEQARRISAAVMRIHLVARRVWTAQRLHRGEFRYGEASVGVRETVTKATDALQDISGQEAVSVVAEWDDLEAIPRLFVDPDVFFEVILNLVHNAVKYSSGEAGGRRPQVIIRGWTDGAKAVISAGNRGIQIQEDEIPLIFNRYYRTPVARRMRPEGSGIGLSIVEDFVDHYRGKTEVTSAPIQGTRDSLTIFKLLLPIGGR